MLTRPAAGTIPDAPGSYQFKDRDGRVIYVGKAKSLRSRLSNYFVNPALLPDRTRHMVTAAESVEWIEVRNEVEALFLEFNLIKKHKPRFNIRLKDDKSYPYLAVTVSEEWPRAMVMRGAKRKGVRYYGPFAHAYAIRETLDLLLRTFPIRTCNDNKLTELGCGVALDDFGTGYGSFSLPGAASITELKIDMEFVRRLTDDPQSQRLVRSIVSAAELFGVTTVAEGVEDERRRPASHPGRGHGSGYFSWLSDPRSTDRVSRPRRWPRRSLTWTRCPSGQRPGLELRARAVCSDRQRRPGGGHRVGASRHRPGRRRYGAARCQGHRGYANGCFASGTGSPNSRWS